MKTEHKQFKPYDRVLVKQCDDAVWGCKFYSHWIGDLYEHMTTDGISVDDEDILPYEGNEHLVGTTNEPNEEVEPKDGEWVFLCDNPSLNADSWCFSKLYDIRDNTFKNKHSYWRYAICFKDFNPENMEETKKHILCVKNGKIVKYKE